MRSAGELSLFLTIFGRCNAFKLTVMCVMLTWVCRLLDKIAKDIMVCEHKTVKRWGGSIGEYKNYLRKKMVTMGQV